MFFPPPQFRASFVFNPLQLSSSFSLSHPRSYHSDTTQKYSCSPLLVLIQGLHGRFNLHRVPLLFKTSVELLFPTPTPEDQVADDWSLIEGLIGMEEVNKIEEIVGDAHNWGSPPAYQAPAAKEWNSPSPAVQPSPAMPQDGIPVVVDPESAATAAALLPWLAIGLALAKKPIN